MCTYQLYLYKSYLFSECSNYNKPGSFGDAKCHRSVEMNLVAQKRFRKKCRDAFRIRILLFLIPTFIVVLTVIALCSESEKAPEISEQKVVEGSKEEYFFNLYKSCYSHQVRRNQQYSDSTQFFEDLLTSSKQPEESKAIFFIDSNCSSSGLLSVSVR